MAVKQAVPISRVLQAYGVRFANKKAKCCFHSDKHPSLTVSESRNIFKCHSCGVGGDAIFFVAKMFGLSNLDAVKKINNDFMLNIDIAAPNRQDQINAQKVIAEREKRKSDYIAAIDEALRMYKVLNIMIGCSRPYSKLWCYAIDRIDKAEYTYDKLIGFGGESDFESGRITAR